MPARKKPTSDAAPPARSRRKKPDAINGEAVATPAKGPARRKAAAPSGSASGPNLVIVESPAKAKTINKYLGPGFRVMASMGHVRDLPKRKKAGEVLAGVDIAKGWVPTYVVIDDRKKKLLDELKKEVRHAGRVYLATDPDREGEAIAWHLEEALGLDDDRTFRITFNEITRSAVQNALAHAGKIDRDRVKAQEARRILDRAVGYPLSGLLKKKVRPQSSAGRVQSVALRLVVDREREIEAFKPEEYWKITALLAPEGKVSFPSKPFSVILARTRKTEDAGKEEKEEKAETPQLPDQSFLAELAEWAGKKFEKVGQELATGVATLLDSASYRVTRIEQKDRQEKPPAPFTTSTLQQQANIRLRFGGERTMKTAQKLYEGVSLGSEGSVALITYMRTDSTRISNEALHAVREHIETTFGKDYLPDSPNHYASGKSAQEAHEAIRPTDLSYTPQRVASLGLAGDQLRLYTLIYNRFVACQMKPAVFAITNVEIQATPTQPVPAAVGPSGASGLFRTQGKILRFDGYRRVMAPIGKQEDATLPALAEQQALDKLDLTASQHFTQPPPRYNEASLIKALEKEGIGRPSTYATIISKITSEERGYIEVKERRFYATVIGKAVTDLLVEYFPRIMDLKFTSQMEEDLDQIETGRTHYEEVLSQFWTPFYHTLKEAEAKMPRQRGTETGEMCPECGRPLISNYSVKTKRQFIGCSGFRDPEKPCKYIKPAEGEEARPKPVETSIPCPTCGKPMVERMGKRGVFLGCSAYPECKTTMEYNAEGQPVMVAQPTEHLCEKCGSPMVIREGRRGPFLACTGYPKCRNAKDVDASGNPVQPVNAGILCEKCNAPMVVKKGPRGPFLGCSAYPKCRSTKPMTAELKEKLKDQLPTPAPKKTMPAVEIHDTCPDCGSPMKLRQGRSGYFLGCSKYPKCRGTREPSPDLLEQLQEAGA